MARTKPSLSSPSLPCLQPWSELVQKLKHLPRFVGSASCASKAVSEDELQEDEGICRVIASFRCIRCNYKRHENAEFYMFESLSTWAVGVLEGRVCVARPSEPYRHEGEAQCAGPDALVQGSGQDSPADACREASVLAGCSFPDRFRLQQDRWQSASHYDLSALCQIVSEAWRVSDGTKRMIYNLLRCPPDLWLLLKRCYNETKPEHSGLMFQSILSLLILVSSEPGELGG